MAAFPACTLRAHSSLFHHTCNSSPICSCVGYSYADTIQGCSHNDSSQAEDNYQALLVFFAGFPEYAPNDFFITG